MIHWFIFNFLVVAVSLSLVFNIRNEITAMLGWILLLIAIVLIIKDLIAVRG